MNNFQLTGETLIYPIIGDPIAQVRSPKFLTAIMHDRGINGIVPPVHVSAELLPTVFEGISSSQNVPGIVVTIPHKVPMHKYCSSLTERASFVGAVNVMRRQPDGSFIGDHLDGVGYLDGMKNSGIEVSNQRVLQIGVGGAGSDFCYEFLTRGAGELGLFDVDTARLTETVTKLSERFPGKVFAHTNDPSGFDIIANVTPIGMKSSDPTPVQADKLSADMAVCDSITKPAVTELIKWARQLGCRTMTGADMFDAEAEALVDFLTA